TWSRTVYNDVQMYCGNRASNGSGPRNASSAGNMTQPQNLCTVRIFTQQEMPCRIGDVIACAICTQGAPQAARDAGVNCYTISGVFDNRRGSARMQHWKLEAK
ncbi:MAG: DUF6751 family protein, partial [Ruthenibacterium sp.]